MKKTKYKTKVVVPEDDADRFGREAADVIRQLQEAIAAEAEPQKEDREQA